MNLSYARSDEGSLQIKTKTWTRQVENEIKVDIYAFQK